MKCPHCEKEIKVTLEKVEKPKGVNQERLKEIEKAAMEKVKARKEEKK